MKNQFIEVPQEDLYTLLHCAINYAFGRTTYMTEIAPAMVRTYWTKLTPDQRGTLTRNLRADVNSYANRTIGHKCDDESWRNLIQWMEDRP